jgi:hypothetical protein
LLGKKIRCKNGVRSVTLHTLHGSYKFDNQLYIRHDGSHTSFLEEIIGLPKNRYSEGLDALICYWANEVSYDKLGILLEDVIGSCPLSRNALEEYLISRAVQISEEQVENSLDLPYDSVEILEDIDVYDEQQEEVILMMDDVSVKAQKPHKEIARTEDDAKRIGTTIALISTKPGSYDTFTEGIDAKGDIIYPIETAILDKLAQHHCRDTPLPIVAITDGARTIRNSLTSVFGPKVCIILDWYHLQHKLTNLMSMIAPNKELKLTYIRDIKAFLWKGETQNALKYLNDISKIKNKEALDELIGYFGKHKVEIINYDKRQNAGKIIGSGRVEKANDLIVAKRQKKKGMAWSKIGSKALAIVKVFYKRNNNIA